MSPAGFKNGRALFSHPALALVLGLTLAGRALAGEISPEDTLPQPPDPTGRSLTLALEQFLSRPFRDDGAQDEQGRWVTFTRPDHVSPTPGFNCSGLAVAAARVLLERPFSLAEAAFDRRGDSGPGAPLGQDWDFGLDLILNLARGQATRPLPEPEQPAAPPPGAGRALGWGVSLHGSEFENILRLIRPGDFAFFCLSRPDGRFPAGISYYHVGLIVPEPPHLWLYHVTRGLRTHRVDLADPGQLARFRRHFPPPRSEGERRIFLLEVVPPAHPGPALEGVARPGR